MNPILENYFKTIMCGAGPDTFKISNVNDDAVDRVRSDLAEVASIMVQEDEIDLVSAALMLADLSKRISSISESGIQYTKEPAESSED